MDRLLTEEELKKITSTDGIVELLCGIEKFDSEKYEDLSEEERKLVDYTMNIDVISNSQINGNLRRSMFNGNIAILNKSVLKALSLIYFGEKDESGKYIRYTCPYTGKKYDLSEIKQELNKTYKNRNLDKVLELEHIIPHSSGGGTVLLNCVLASKEANSVSEKGNLHLLDWLTRQGSSGYEYYKNGGIERLEKLVNYIISAYQISFKEYQESELEFLESSEEETDGVDNDYDLEFDDEDIEVIEKKVKSRKVRETPIEGYIPFLNQLINKLEQEGVDTKAIRDRLNKLEKNGVIKNLNKYNIVQETIEELFKQEDSKSYLTASLNVNYIKLVKSISTNDPKKIRKILETRFSNIKTLVPMANKTMVGYFISIKDMIDVDLLYKDVDINDLESEEVKAFIGSIKLGHNEKIDLFIEMLSEEKYTGYKNGKPNKNNVLGVYNKVPFKGYEDIEGLNTSHFWSPNSVEIKIRLEELEGKKDIDEEKREKYKRARREIEKYEFYNQTEKRIDCFIEMLSEEQYTGYEKGVPNKNNIFSALNKVLFKGYEDIKGLNTSNLWCHNSDEIKIRLEELERKENISEEEREKYRRARKAIDDYDFSNQNRLERRIDCYIEMLSEERYIGYEKGVPNKNNILKVENKIPFKGHEDIEGLNTSHFWSHNSVEIKIRLEELENQENISEEEREKYARSKNAIERYENYLSSRNSAKRLEEESSELTLSDIQKAKSTIKGIIDKGKEIA